MPTLHCFCGTLMSKNELKCTKNFKALYLLFTKCNGTVFWQFGTDMTPMGLKYAHRLGHNGPGKIMTLCGKQKVSDMSISYRLSLVKHIVCSCLGYFVLVFSLGSGKRNKKTRNTWLSKLNQHTVSSYTPTSFISCHHSTQDAHVEFITKIPKWHEVFVVWS